MHYFFFATFYYAECSIYCGIYVSPTICIYHILVQCALCWNSLFSPGNFVIIVFSGCSSHAHINRQTELWSENCNLVTVSRWCYLWNDVRFSSLMSQKLLIISICLIFSEHKPTLTHSVIVYYSVLCLIVAWKCGSHRHFRALLIKAILNDP